MAQLKKNLQLRKNCKGGNQGNLVQASTDS